jgi:hypothetical protein
LAGQTSLLEVQWEFYIGKGIYVVIHKYPFQCKISLYLKTAGLAGRNIVQLFKKSSYAVSVFAFIFSIFYVKPIRSLLIQRIPAGSSVASLINILQLSSTTCFSNLSSGSWMFAVQSSRSFCGE